MLDRMDDDEMARELAAAQDDVKKAPVRRRKAVMQARGLGWTKYRIAAVLNVKGPTVDAIIEAAEREEGGTR